MSGLEAYVISWLICYVWIIGVVFSHAVHDPKFRIKYTYREHLAGAALFSAFVSLLLILSVGYVYYNTDRVRFGWSLRMPK